MSDIMEMDPQEQDARYAADSKLYVVFSMKAVKNGFRSEQEGRAIFDDVPHIRIHVPGDKNTIVDCPVTEEHKIRFASRWERFQKGMTQAPQGTPVEQWPQLTVGQVQELKYLNIYTVEQLAELSDAAAQKFMGGMELKRKATAFLAVAKDTAEAQRLAEENAELRATMTDQQAQINELAQQVRFLTQKTSESSAPSAQQQDTSGQSHGGNNNPRAVANGGKGTRPSGSA